MTRSGEETMRIDRPIGAAKAQYVIHHVHRALEEKGYDAISQMVGYLLSGDPTFITSHAGARNLIRTVDRDELMEELVGAYVGDGRKRRTVDG